MTPTTYQTPEIRDSNDNIIQQGAFGKNTALSNATNDGWIDYVANDLEALNNNKADSASPAFTGTPTAPTPTAGDNSTKLATTEFVHNNTDDKLPLSGGTMTGDISANKTDFWIANTYSGNAGTVTIRSARSSYKNGAQLILYGMGASGVGKFSLGTGDGTNYPVLEGKPDGTLTWYGKNIARDVKTGSANGTISVNGSDVAVKGLGSRAYDSTSYLPIAGGSMSGNIRSNSNDMFVLRKENTSYGIQLWSGSSYNTGASLSLYGKDNSNAGTFNLGAYNGTNYSILSGMATGSLTWGGQPVQTSSDKRLKQDFSNVPADVLEAWGKVEWKQFKYKADVERKGDKCRFHTGLVAQDVKEVGEENNVDLLKYGILCHDVREAVEEEKDENGNVIKEASEAVDLWTVRYEEALAMEAIYQRKRADELEERIARLEALLDRAE